MKPGDIVYKKRSSTGKYAIPFIVLQVIPESFHSSGRLVLRVAHRPGRPNPEFTDYSREYTKERPE